MEKTIIVGDKRVKMRADARTPRSYRFKFGRDIFKDLTKLKKAYNKANRLPENATEEEREEAALSELDLTIFENVAYIMAKQADKSQPDTPDEWLEQFDMFSIYQALPQILTLWNLSTATTSKPKKG